MVGQTDDFLSFDLMADFRPAEDDPDIGSRRLERTHHRSRLDDIPDIHTETDDLDGARTGCSTKRRKQFIDDFADRPRDGEFTQRRVFPQLAHVGEYVAQAERRVDVLGVECRQDDGRLRSHSRRTTPAV